jgi:hypothetical protein
MRSEHYTSSNVSVIVDFYLQFTYMLACWEGSAHGANILAGRLFMADGLNICDGKFYLFFTKHNTCVDAHKYIHTLTSMSARTLYPYEHLRETKSKKLIRRVLRLTKSS